MNSSYPLHLKWNWQLRSEPAKLWPLVADANRLFKNIGLPTVQSTDITYDAKSMHRQLSYNSLKHADAWIEEPFEWEYPYRYGVKREYKSGSFSKMKIAIDLVPNDRGTRLQYQLWAIPKNRFLFHLYQLKFKIRLSAKLKAIFKKYAILTEHGTLPYEYDHKKQISRSGRQRLNLIKNELYGCNVNRQILDKLCDFIQRADDLDLLRIHPKQLARHWQTDQNETLLTFLHSVKKGILNFNWDVCCPKCRKVKQRCKTLNEVHEPIFCSECNSEFHINFNETLQLSFRPHPLIRKVDERPFSEGGPRQKPHVHIQQYVKPGEKCYVRTKLEKQADYHIYSSNTKGKSLLRVDQQGQNTLNIRLTEKGFEGETSISDNPDLIFHNQTKSDQLFILEKVGWNPDIISAAEITSLQAFRDLFSHEILKQGEKIAVDQLTFMFTDLDNSTGMYNQQGDSRATGRVIEHFDILQKAIAQKKGAIVKTIGDSVMAVFTNPSDALQAFTSAQSMIGAKGHRNKLKLKASIHEGSCVAVNLNNRMDYFGSTVNVAARMVEMADENEIILSEKTIQNTPVKHILNSHTSGFTMTSEQTILKGFDQHKFSIKRIRPRSSALRLVI